MLTTRLWMGTVLVLVAVACWPSTNTWPVVSVPACVSDRRGATGMQGTGRPAWTSRSPQVASCFASVTLLSVGNWLVHWQQLRPFDPWFLLLVGFVAIVLAVTVIEMTQFHGPGRSMERMGLTWLVVIYLGLLPCFSPVALAASSGTDARQRRPRPGDLRAQVLRHRRLHDGPPDRPSPNDAGPEPKENLEGAVGGLALVVWSPSPLTDWGPCRCCEMTWRWRSASA